MSNKVGFALMGVSAAMFMGIVLVKRGSGSTPDPPLPPVPPSGAGEVARMATELEALRPAVADAKVNTLLARLGRSGALGADDLAEAQGAAKGLVAAIPALLDIVGPPPADDTPRPKHSAKDPAARLRRADAARLLGAIGDPRAIPSLGRLLDSANTDPYVQEAAAEALGAIGDRAALVPLLSLLWEDRAKDWRVTIAASLAAMQLGSAKGGDEIVKVLTNWDDDMSKRPRVFDRERAVLQAFVPLAGREVAEYDPYMLPPQLQKAGAAWKTWWETEGRSKVVSPARVTTSPELLDGLLKRHLAYFEGTSFFYRKRAQNILSSLGADGMPYLLHELRHADSEHRRHAAEALGELDDRHASGDLVALHLIRAFHREENTIARAQIVKALARRGANADAESGYRRVMAEAALDPDLSVRDAAKPAVSPK